MAVKSITIAYVIAIAAVLAFGTFGTYILGQSGNFNVHINSLITALYFTVVTVGTVGYGDIVPVTALGRVFDIVLIISGLAVFLSVVTAISGEVVNQRLVKLSGRISSFEKRLLKGHIVLIGYDLTNVLLASKLKKEGKKFIVVTSDKVIVDQLREKGYSTYVADETSESDMSAFNLGNSKKIIIDLRESSRTVYAAIVAKSLSSIDKVIVIANTEELERHLTDLGLKHIISPANIVAKTIFSEIGK